MIENKHHLRQKYVKMTEVQMCKSRLNIATIQGNHPRSSSEIVATDEDRHSYPDKDLSEEQSAVGAVLFIGSYLMI